MLISEIKTEDKQSISFVLDCLDAYRGQSFLHNVCKEVVRSLAYADPKLERLKLIILKTVAVSDPCAVEYCFRHLDEEKSRLFKEWQQDPDTNVRNFAKKLCNEFDNVRIKEEQRKGEERYNLGQEAFND